MNRIDQGTITSPLWAAFNTATNAFDKTVGNRKPWQIVAGTVAAATALILLYRITQIELKPKIAAIALWWNAKKIAKERADFRLDMERKNFTGGNIDGDLPAKGISKEELIRELEAGNHELWQSGKATGAVYHNRPDIKEVALKAIEANFPSNPLHPSLFPDVRKHEASIVRMTLGLFNGNNETCGAVTSGGTESIFLACLAARNRAKKLYPNITAPEILVPSTAHGAFKKAAHYLGVKLIRVPCDPSTFKADIKAMEKAISANTILIVGSCPTYPHGMIDPIEELSLLVEKYQGRIGLHVDCCLGSFLVPLIPNLPPFDFRLKNVTSISADTHKYGYAPKGTSVIMFRNEKWLRSQIFTDPTWVGGAYGTPTTAGSRSGALVSATWAVMRYMGMDGYRAAAGAIYSRTQELYNALLRNPDIEVLGIPQVSVVAFTFKNKDLDIYELKDIMNTKGWYVADLQHPPAVHFCLTLMHADDAEFTHKFMTDLQATIDELKAVSLQSRVHKKKGTAALYGTMHKIPNSVGWLTDEIFSPFVEEFFLINYQTRPRLWKRPENSSES